MNETFRPLPNCTLQNYAYQFRYVCLSVCPHVINGDPLRKAEPYGESPLILCDDVIPRQVGSSSVTSGLIVEKNAIDRHWQRTRCSLLKLERAKHPEMGIRETGLDNVDWMHQARYKDKWRILVSMVMDL